MCLIILLWCLDLYSEGKFTTLSLTQLGLWWSFSRSMEHIHRYFSSLVFSYCPQFNGNLKASSFTGHECLIRKSNTTFYSHAWFSKDGRHHGRPYTWLSVTWRKGQWMQECTMVPVVMKLNSCQQWLLNRDDYQTPDGPLKDNGCMETIGIGL